MNETISRIIHRAELADDEDSLIVSTKDLPDLVLYSTVLANEFAPKSLLNTFHMTDLGGRELEFLQSAAISTEPHPLGWRILLFLSHGNLMTIGPLAKILGKERGHVKRVMESLQNKGLVDCLYSRTRTSFGHDVITHLWKITDLGRQVLDADPEAYLRIVRSHKQRTGRSSNLAAK